MPRSKIHRYNGANLREPEMTTTTARKPFPVPVKTKSKYDCLKCPGYCCSYQEIEVNQRDIDRLAKHFGISPKQAEERFTKWKASESIHLMRHRKDTVFDSICMMFDQDKRRCTVYEARPGVCRKYPDSKTCGYYEFLKFEREQQGDEELVALT
jgi:Fe-S-cluster containining protein